MIYLIIGLVALLFAAWQYRIYVFVPVEYRAQAAFIEHGCWLRADLPRHRTSIATVVLTPTRLYTKDVLPFLAIYQTPNSAIEREFMLSDIENINRTEGRFNCLVRVTRPEGSLDYEVKLKNPDAFVREARRLLTLHKGVAVQ